MTEYNAKYPPLARGPVCGGSCVYHGRRPSCELAMVLQQSVYRFAPHFNVPIIYEVLGVPSEATFYLCCVQRQNWMRVSTCWIG